MQETLGLLEVKYPITFSGVLPKLVANTLSGTTLLGSQIRDFASAMQPLIDAINAKEAGHPATSDYMPQPGDLTIDDDATVATSIAQMLALVSTISDYVPSTRAFWSNSFWANPFWSNARWL